MSSIAQGRNVLEGGSQELVFTFLFYFKMYNKSRSHLYHRTSNTDCERNRLPSPCDSRSLPPNRNGAGMVKLNVACARRAPHDASSTSSYNT